MMRRAIAFCFGSIALLAAVTAQADAPWETGIVVPTAQLSGSTTGKGQVSAGVDIRTSRSSTLDIFLNPSFTVSSNGGVASIVAATSADGAKGPTQFSGSLSVTFASTSTDPLKVDVPELTELSNAGSLCLDHLGSPDALSDEQAFAKVWLGRNSKSLMNDLSPANAAAHQALTTAIGVKISALYPGCAFAGRDAEHTAHCQCGIPNKVCDAEVDSMAAVALGDAAKACWGVPAAGAPPICAWLTRPNRTGLVQVSELCDAGKSYIRDSKTFKEKTHELRKLLYPQHLFSVGATYGAAVFKYLEGSGATLKASSSTRSSGGGNVLYTLVQSATGARFTLEVPVGLKATWTESTKTAYQCSPVGTLAGQSVQTCTTTPMNEPTQGFQLTAAVLGGVAGVAESDLWRAAIGPVFMYDFAADAPTKFQVGGEIPLYFSLIKAAGYAGDYEGMVRIMPTVLAEQTKDAKGVSTMGISASLSIALLGKRKMFGSQLYWP